MTLLTRSLSLFALLLVLAAPARADFGPRRGQAATQSASEPAPAEPASTPPRSRSTLPESVRRVENQTGGEVLRAEPMQRDGREVYRLKVLTADGRVRVMQEDPRQYRGDSRPERRRDDRRERQDRYDGDRGNDPASLPAEAPPPA